tara:strand:- start:3285 stop:4325 length:1041 start_codon:yes stop_codon:yes gene_type:complete
MLSLLNTIFTNTLRQGSTLIGSLLSKLKARSTYFENQTCTKATLKEFEAIPSVIIRPFITTWTTAVDGETITIPTNGSGYDYTVKTSDGQKFENVIGNKTITFATAGDYDVSITGAFPTIRFNDEGDKLKIIDIKQWGNIAWTSLNKAFKGCSNLVGTYTDAPDLSGVIILSETFRQCSAFTGKVSNWDVSNVTTMGAMFRSCTVFNSDCSSWDTSNVVYMNSMFQSARAFNQDISTWNVSNVITMSLMFNTTVDFDQNLGSWDISIVSAFSNFKTVGALSVANYDALLIGWVANLDAYVAAGNTYSLTPTIGFGFSKYTGGGAAEAARAKLEATYSWTITDSGEA